MIDVLDIRLGSKFSITPARALVAPIGGFVPVEIDFFIHWEAENFDGTFSGNQIISNDGTNFITNGFKPGDIIHVVTHDSTSVNDGDYEVINVSASVLYVTGIGSGSASTTTPVTFTTQVGVEISVYGTTPITTIDYFFDLLENSASPTYTSLLDGELQRFKCDEIDATSTASLLPYTTNKSWVTGSSSEQALNQIIGTGIGTSGASTGYEQCFTLIHKMHIAPMLLDSWLDGSGQPDINLVPFFNMSNCLKYVPRITAGFASMQVDHTTDNGNLPLFLQPGNTGFYGEHRNGGAAIWSFDSINYSVSGVPATAINKVGTTQVTIVIKKLTGNYAGNEYVDLYIQEIPDEPNDYTNNITNMWYNLRVSNVFAAATSSGGSNNQITNLSTSYSGDELTIVFDYTTYDQNRRYFIYADVGSPLALENKSNHHTIKIALSYFKLHIDTSSVLPYASIYINDHTSNDPSIAYSDYKGWIEDGLLATKQFSIKKKTGPGNAYDVTLNKVSVDISCEHNTDPTRKFTLEAVGYPLPTISTRGFLLPTGDPKNYKRFVQLTGTTDYYEFLLEHATKLRFEQNIILSGADPDFPLATQRWSYYDSNPNWSVYLNVVVTLSITGSGGISEIYTDTHKVRIRIKDYDQYNECQKTCVIKTYDAATLTEVTPKSFKDRNTKVIARFYGKALFPCIYERIGESRPCTFEQVVSGSGSFSSGTGDIEQCPDYYGILEILPINGSELDIDQISTIWDKRAGSKWIGTVNPDRAHLVAYPYATPEPYIEVEADVDYTAINTTIPSHYYSARLGKMPVSLCQKSIMVSIESSTTSYTNSLLSGYTEDDLFVIVSGFELIGKLYANLVGDTITFNPALSIKNVLKIFCAKNKTLVNSNGSGEITSSLLVGLGIEDFIVFRASNGKEMTTLTGVSFNSLTGTISGVAASQPFYISFHESFVYDNSLSGATSYTDAGILGKTLEDLIVFGDGIELTTSELIISGDTITFDSPLTGTLKIIYTNQ